MAGTTFKRTQLDSIAFDAGQQRPTRGMLVDSAILAMICSLRYQVDIAAGGGADGARVVEGELRILNRLRIMDGSTPVLDADPRSLFQISARRAEQQASGTVLANTGIQAATQIRQQFAVFFSDPRLRNPAECFLKFRDTRRAYLEAEWIGTTQAQLAAAFNTGGTRAITVSNLALDIMLIHDPVMFRQVAPLFVPRFRTYQQPAIQTSAEYDFEYKASGRLAYDLLATRDAGIGVENAVNRLGFEDQDQKHDERILSRTHHEWEQQEYAGTPDGEVGMAYFFKEFTQNGLLSKAYRPGQGAVPKHRLDVTGAATRTVELVTCELEEVPGLTAEQDRPDWAK